jgi:hypothetical protein
MHRDSSNKRWVSDQDGLGSAASANRTPDIVEFAETNDGPAPDIDIDAALRVHLADVQRQLRALNGRL